MTDDRDQRARRVDPARSIDPTPDANRDPLTGEAGSHPVGTGVGAAGGAAAGAAVGGAVGGPLGALVGGTVGAVAGGAAGHAAGEGLDPTVESEYWRRHHHTRPYYEPGVDYSAYEPAYRYGWESATHDDYRGREFEDVEPELERNWARRMPGRAWHEVRDATRDAWERVRARR